MCTGLLSDFRSPCPAASSGGLKAAWRTPFVVVWCSRTNSRTSKSSLLRMLSVDITFEGGIATSDGDTPTKRWERPCK